jgi:hypothetical protein
VVRYDDLMRVKMWTVVSWVMTPCILLGSYRFGGMYCLPEDEGDMFLENVGIHLQDYTAS